MTIEDLEADLAAVRLAAAPDQWALAAYRLAVARAEAASQPDDLEQALGLLDKAARILTADRAPVEHGRILTAAANCHRASGRADRALELFVRAEKLLEPRAPVPERVGTLVNLGLACYEAGQPKPAIEALDRAVDLIRQIHGHGAIATDTPDHTIPQNETDTPDRGPDHDETDAPDQTIPQNDQDAPDPQPDHDETDTPDRGSDGDKAGSAPSRELDDELGRLLGAALINRAQARQAIGSDEDLVAAVEDYRAAVTALPGSSLQTGMASHGLGAAVLELFQRGVPGWDADTAVAAFGQSLAVLGHASFPFHHAVARHSLALAYEMRSGPGDQARALNSAHASISVFDPRLHPSHWRTAHATLARLEAALDDGGSGTGRLGHVAHLLAATTEAEREQLLRDRLLRAASLPSTPMGAELDALIGSLAALETDEYRLVLRTLIGVLMELPDPLLEAACETIFRVHREHESAAALDAALDSVINDRLFGPQRVRVRDLLEANGWIRP